MRRNYRVCIRIYRSKSVRRIRRRVCVRRIIRRVNYKAIKSNRTKYFRTVSWIRAYKNCGNHRLLYRQYLKTADSLRKAYLKTPAASRTPTAKAEFMKAYSVAYGRTYVNRLTKQV
jgi:hypothetical protein